MEGSLSWTAVRHLLLSWCLELLLRFSARLMFKFLSCRSVGGFCWTPWFRFAVLVCRLTGVAVVVFKVAVASFNNFHVQVFVVDGAIFCSDQG